jgi:KaiC/GvpD/RAD55 family RecA-like ATPase
MNKQIKFDPEDEEFFGSVGSFGVPKFDNAMHGGVPRGFLVVGFTQMGAGSELFAKQFTSPAEEADNTILISTNESQLEIARVFKKYGWPTDIAVRTLGEEYNARVLEKELLASRYRLEGFKLPDIQRLAQTRFVDDETQDFLTEMTNEIMAMGPYFRAVIDSLDFFVQREDPSRVVAMLRMMQAHTQINRGILFVTISADTISSSIKQEIAAIADMVCEFKVRTIGSDFETSMIVSKFRNAPENLSIMVFRVTPEEGITPETVERIA